MLKPIFATSCTNLLIQVVSAATSIIAARSLGPDGRGWLAAALLMPSIVASFGTFGLETVLARRAASANSEDKSKYAEALVFGLLIGTVLSPIVLLYVSIAMPAI